MIDAVEESANVMVSESTKRGLLRARRRGVKLGQAIHHESVSEGYPGDECGGTVRSEDCERVGSAG